MSNHFIGVDAGGSRTRAMLATANGEVLGTGRAAGANSWSSGTSASLAVLSAVGEALRECDPASVAGGVVAIAGGGAFDPGIRAEIDAGWLAHGLPGSPRVVIDVVAAYAAGTIAPRGVVIAAGTGAIAAIISDGELERRSGGHGWLVGDEGSAVWLGVEAVRAVLMALDGRGPSTTLQAPILDALGVREDHAGTVASQIVSATYGRPPAQLGALAPVVVEASGHGDAVARRLTAGAADHLTALAIAVAGDEAPATIVLGGALLTQAAPIKDVVRERIAARWPGLPVVQAASGEAGAVALAISADRGAPINDATLGRLQRGGSR